MGCAIELTFIFSNYSYYASQYKVFRAQMTLFGCFAFRSVFKCFLFDSLQKSGVIIMTDGKVMEKTVIEQDVTDKYSTSCKF